MTGQQEIQQFKAAGFTDEEIANWMKRESQRLTDAGFRQDEISAYWGRPVFDEKPVKDLVAANLAAGSKDAEGKPKPVTSVMEAIEAGLQMSTAGLALRGQRPNLALTEDAGRVQRIAEQMGTLVGDVPAMVAGAVIGSGGGPVLSMAGAVGLQQGLRRILMDKYDKGEVSNFPDFWDRLSSATLDTIKGLVTGAATGAAGKAVGLAPIISPTAKAAATIGAEVTTMVTVGKALEGQVPKPDDFLDAAIVLGFVKGATGIASKLRKIYAETGVKPSDVVQDTSIDPTILQDLASDRTAIPRHYEDAMADAMAKERAPVGKSVERRPTGEYVETPPPKPSITELAGKAITPGVVKTSETGAFYPPGQPPVARVTPPYEARPAPMPTAKDLVTGKAALDLAREGETQVFEKPRALRSAEEILQERNLLKPAEAMISQEPRPTLREKMYLLPKGRGPVISDSDMAELTRELGKMGIELGKDAEPKWTENIPVTDAEQKVLDRIVMPEKEASKLTLRGLYTSVVDYLDPIKQAIGKSPEDITQDPYKLSRLNSGTVGRAEQWLNHGVTDFETYQTVTRGYAQILKPIIKDLNGFRAYSAAKRAIEKEGQGIQTGFPIEEAKAVIKAGREKYEPIFRETVGFRDAMLKNLLKAGILNQEKYEAIKEANKDYVPFYRFFEEAPSGNAASTQGVKQPVKEMKGSQRQIHDPIISDIKNIFLFNAITERNAARLAFVDRGEALAKKIPGEHQGFTKAEAKELAQELGLDESAGDAIATLTPESLNGKTGELAVYRDGVREVYRVDPKIAEAFDGLDHNTAGLAANMLLYGPAKLLRAGVTVTPDFISRNVLRDSITAFIYAGSHPVKTVKGAVSILKQDTAFQNWMKGGGANATMVAIDRQYLQQHIGELNAETGVMERAWNVARTPYDLLHVLSEFIENSTRVGAVRGEIAQAKTKAQMQALAYLAREATVDFARRGRDLESFSKMTAFFNPTIQGIDRFFRAVKDQPMETVSKSLLSVTLPSLLLWWANKDDKDIENLPNWQKRLFWVTKVPLPDGGSFILRIPKPQEIGLIFGTLPEMLLDEFVKQKPDAFKDIHNTMMDMFTPSFVPTVAAPILAQISNRVLFTGGTLIPLGLEHLMPEYQHTEYTTETAKALGHLLGAFPGLEKEAMRNEDQIFGGVARALTTPILLENYLRAWTGGMGMYGLQLTDKLLREAGVVPDPVKPASTLADIPVVKAFVVRYPSASAQSIQDFYDTYAMKKKVYDSLQAKMTEGNKAEVDQILGFDSSSVVQLTGIMTTLSDQNKMIRDISKAPTLTSEEKRQLIDALYYRMIELSKYGMTMMRALETKTKPTP